MILMPAMPGPQTASWHALMDLYERLDSGWTLVGGQLVHLHCAERDHASPKPTDDVDAVVDVRAEPRMLNTFTATLRTMDFEPGGISAEGIQHRWVRGDAVMDVLLPEGVGERAASRTGVTGSPTIRTPGGTQALHRTESVAVTVDGRAGSVRRPNLVGALVMKAAAHLAPGDPARQRHRYDFATLAALVAASDFRGQTLSNKDRQRLRAMINATRADREVMLGFEAEESVSRVEVAAGLRRAAETHEQTGRPRD